MAAAKPIRGLWQALRRSIAGNPAGKPRGTRNRVTLVCEGLIGHDGRWNHEMSGFGSNFDSKEAAMYIAQTGEFFVSQ